MHVISVAEKDREEHNDGAGQDAARRRGRRDARPAYVSARLLARFRSSLVYYIFHYS